MGGGRVLWLALAALLAGVYLQLRIRQSKHHAQVHQSMRVNMMLSMAIPFAAEVLVERLTGSEILAILLAVVGTLVSMVAVQNVIRIEETGTWFISALMSAGMGAMMVGMPDSAVVNLVLIGITLANGIVSLVL